jgi:SAM-dependent methyltransferase
LDFKRAAKRIIPPAIYRPARIWWKRRQAVSWTNLRRLTPISRIYGLDRGRCLDRYYIESFLNSHSADIKGRVLEILDAHYTQQFGGGRVTVSDVLHVAQGNPQATIIGDLATGQGLPLQAFDCLIVTQTFQLIYEVQSAIANCYRALKPGGVLLASFPSICQISRYDMDRWGDYWRFTTRSVKQLCATVFPQNDLDVRGYGNVLVAVSYLHGMAVEDLSADELDYHDPDYEIVITVRAVKPVTDQASGFLKKK